MTAELASSSIGRSLALVWSCLAFFLFVPTFLSSMFHTAITTIVVCFSLLFHTCFSHAWGILCGIHTSCMGSPFTVVHADPEWFRMTVLCCVEKKCLKLTKIIIISLLLFPLYYVVCGIRTSSFGSPILTFYIWLSCILLLFLQYRQL